MVKVRCGMQIISVPAPWINTPSLSMHKFRDPVALFQAAIAALNAKDFAGVAALCHITSLRTLRRELAQHVAPTAPQYEPTAEDFMKSDPGMPREVAEYQVAQHKRHANAGERFRREFPGVESVERFHEMDDAAVVAAWLDGSSLHRQWQSLIDQSKITQEKADAITAAGFVHYRFTVVGAIADGENIAPDPVAE